MKPSKFGLGAMLSALLFVFMGVTAPTAQAIIGGERADNRGIAAILLDNKGNCTGSIVSNYWVLTAKHCIMYDTNGNNVPDTKYATNRIKVRVKADTWNYGDGMVNVAFSKVRSEKDVAMLKLTRSANAEPVRLATAHPKIGATTYVFGYGTDSKPYLYRATMRVVSNSVSDGYGGPAILASRGNGVTCHGDSGGPLFKLVDGKRYQVGITSTGDCQDRTHFASVPSSYAWINKVMADF